MVRKNRLSVILTITKIKKHEPIIDAEEVTNEEKSTKRTDGQ